MSYITPMVGTDFWLGRWQRGETGWHQEEVEPALEKWAGLLKPCRILVPLCGKSLDLAWLSSKGFQVIGIELSEIACRAFFDENKIEYKTCQENGFQVFEGDSVKIFNGDFFKVTPELLGKIEAVYDRAALIALPEELREKYSSYLQTLIASSQNFLQIAIARTPHDLTGPPFSVPESEVRKLYESRFDVSLVSKEKVIARAPEGSTTEEFVFYFKSR